MKEWTEHNEDKFPDLKPTDMIEVLSDTLHNDIGKAEDYNWNGKKWPKKWRKV